jgi:hypothetical protein
MKKYRFAEKNNAGPLKKYFNDNKENIKGTTLGSYKIIGVGEKSIMLKHVNDDTSWVKYNDILKACITPNEAIGPISLIINKYIEGITIDIVEESEASELFRKIIDQNENYNVLVEIQALLDEKIDKKRKDGNYRERLDLNKILPTILITDKLITLAKNKENTDVNEKKLSLMALEIAIKEEVNDSLQFHYRGVSNIFIMKEQIKWQMSEISGIFKGKHVDGFYKIDLDSNIVDIYYIK